MKQKKPPFFNPAEWEIVRWDMLITIPTMSVFSTLLVSYGEVVRTGVTFGNGAVAFMRAYLFTVVTFLPVALLIGVVIGCPLIYFFYVMKKSFIAACCHTPPEKIDISMEHWR
jgi:hypothetical protein